MSEPELIHQWTLAEGDTIGVERFAVDWRELWAKSVTGTVLQIGSRASVLDNTRHWRKVFSHCRVVGMDLEAGDNVDVVADITLPAAEIRRRAGVKAFDAIICSHVLEHVKAPWEAAKTIHQLLAPGGTALLVVPWVQGYHEFPEDYWRMSFAGIRALFPGLSFETEFYTGSKGDVGYRLLYNGTPEHSRRTLRIERNLFQLTLDDQPAQPMFDDRPGTKLPLSRFLMPACSVNLIGRKRA